VAQSHEDRAIYMAYPVNEDGSLGTGKVLFDATYMLKMKSVQACQMD